MATSINDAILVELLGDVGKLHDSIKAIPKSFESVHGEIESFSKKINEVSEQALTKHIATTSNTLMGSCGRTPKSVSSELAYLPEVLF